MKFSFRWRMKTSFVWGLLIFAVVWSLLTLAFDRLIGYSVYRQIRAESHPSVPGVITRCEVVSESSGDNATYDVGVGYEYKVGAKEYKCDMYRWGSYITSDPTPVQTFVTQHPPGTKVSVYYDLDEPGDAVLQPGVQNMNFFFVLLLTPFNVAMAGVWFFAIQTCLRRVWPRPAGGVPILRRPYGVHLRLPLFPPLASFAATAAGIPFVSVFIVGIGMKAELPAAGLLFVWGIMIAGSAGVYVWQRYRVGSGLNDLVIDPEREVFSLPQTYGRDGSQEYPLSSILGVEVNKTVHRDNDGSYTTYTPQVVFIDSDDNQRCEPLVTWQDRDRAESLAEWLNERLMPEGEE